MWVLSKTYITNVPLHQERRYLKQSKDLGRCRWPERLVPNRRSKIRVQSTVLAIAEDGVHWAAAGYRTVPCSVERWWLPWKLQ